MLLRNTMPKARSLTAASTALDSDRRSVGASQKVSEAQAMPIGKRDSANLSGVSMPGAHELTHDQR